jgi:hypothetical protein
MLPVGEDKWMVPLFLSACMFHACCHPSFLLPSIIPAFPKLSLVRTFENVQLLHQRSGLVGIIFSFNKVGFGVLHLQ